MLGSPLISCCGLFRAGALAISGILAVPIVHAQTPAQIVTSMASAEVAARNQDNFYTYTADEVSPRTGGHRWTEKVAELSDGSLHRLIAIDGKPLTPGEAKAEADRINDIVRHPEDFRRTGAAHKDDEAHAGQLLQLLPRAFLITPAGEVNGCMQFAFRPDPAYQPSTYEERVAAAMAGTVSLKAATNRLCTLQATIIRPVEFGFGLLGKIQQGGHFLLDRTPVDAVHWKSSRISVHMQGRILLMKTLTREQEVKRTEIHLLPRPITLEQAAQLTLL